MRLEEQYPTLWHLMRAVACKLAGRPVELRCQRPVYVGRNGQAYKGRGEIGVIDIDPFLTLERQFYVLLHEAAHIKHDFATLPETSHLREASIDIRAEDRLIYAYHPVIKAQESRADQAAKAWQAYADKHYREYSPDYGDLVRKLLALTNYSEAKG